MSSELIELPPGCPPLNSYYFYLTEGCNLACRHCWISPTLQRDGGSGGHLDYALFALAIEEGIPLGLNHVKLTGGEPLLHPDFGRLVDLLKVKGMSLSLETNGTLLTRDLVDRLKNCMTIVSVSLDGATPETHDAFRGVKGSFQKACQGIAYLVQAGYHPQVIMSLHSGNIDEMEALARLAQELGAGSVKFNLIQPTGRGELMSRQNLTLDTPRMIELGTWVERDLQKRVSISLHYSWPMAFYSLKSLLTFNGYSCNIFSILGILPTGHLAMCGIGAQEPKLCYGRLGKDRVADVWISHPLLTELRQQLPADLEGICGECIFRDRCLGMCVAQNYFISKRLTAPFWFCQAADEKGLFPSSRRCLRKG